MRTSIEVQRRSESVIHTGWATVAIVLLGGLAWMLYTPGHAQSTGLTLSVVEHLLSMIPGALTPGDPGFDKIAHATGFAVVTAAALLARWNRSWVVALSIGHAALSEVIQWAFIRGRTGDIADFVFDVGGIVVAWAVVAWWCRYTLTDWRLT
ncbi:MAG: VanZ family protein [Actinomycetaceae bacterium]|nr:VanZ family protein [Actinomycetaceae bacterium]